MGKNFKKWIECLKEPILAILGAFLISSFIVSHARIPTESMVPTIQAGDHLVVNRMPYYYRNPVHGELIIFEHENEHLVKRVIGVPGDVVDIKDGYIYLNDEKLEESNYVLEDGMTFPFSKSEIELPYTVPNESYFVLGDNRRDSSDSRLFGPIKRENVIAKAGYRIYPFNTIGIVR